MYLETILILSRNGGVRAIDVGEYMGYSKPSVSRALGLLKQGGYVEVEVEFPKFQKGVWPIFGLTATDGNMYKGAYDLAAIQGDRRRWYRDRL